MDRKSLPEVKKIPGSKYVGELPEWSNGDSRFGWLGDGQGNTDIVLLHPMHPPHILNKETQRFEPMSE